MDGAARRVRAADLARLTRLRERREEEAARQLRRLAAERAEAERAMAAAAVAVAERLAEREAGERRIYDDLGRSGPMGLVALERQRRALSDLGEALDLSREEEAAREEAFRAAADRHEGGRVEHARAARENQQWAKARDRILSVQRRESEMAAEIELEDEILMRRSRGEPA